MPNVRQSCALDQKVRSSRCNLSAYNAPMTSLIDDARSLQTFLANHPRAVVLTGAGISASSGIPTYRDAGGHWRASEPVKHQEFLSDPARRRRYWARSLAGWPAVRDARPNPAHFALARLEKAQRIELVITQNVDRLHQQAGSRSVIDLHGRLDRVRCLDCGTLCSRETVQRRLGRTGLAGMARPGDARPDGDAFIPDDQIDHMAVPDCTRCGGVLMPDVVFFGGTVPRERVTTCKEAILRSDALLAVGTSLQVYSGFRFCRLATELGKPLAIINPGKTRADSLARLKLSSDCGPLLSHVADHLGPSL